MIVYGDPEFSISGPDVGEAWLALAARADDNLDQCRDLLIASGQIEQAVADSGEDPRPFQNATDAVARSFLAAVRRKSFGPVEGCLGAINNTVERLRAFDRLRIKIPEGYAFYSLYPEQYVRATDAWLQDNPRSGRILVVGIRSIGTSISAVVLARLLNHGQNANRITVRPSGHPFQRQLELPGVRDFDCAIVVDEGPGLSGSSIAATVRSLRQINIERIAIFPGHAGEPGGVASADTQKIWREIPRYVCSSIGGRIHESFLFLKIKRRTEALLYEPVETLTDLSAGGWRKVVAGVEGVKTAPALERTKWLFGGRSGRAIVWKFAGLGCGPGFKSIIDEAANRQQALARRGWCGEVLDRCDGFAALEWVDGTACDRSDCDPEVLAAYILDAAQRSFDEGTREGAIERLRQIVRVNIDEALGCGAASRASQLLASFDWSSECPGYGDGRLAPHEWIRRRTTLLKTDVWGHEWDHTAVGQQSVLWDIAGASVEWDLSDAQEARFIHAFKERGLSIDVRQLDLYKLAYDCFHAGMTHLFIMPGADDRFRRVESMLNRLTS